MKQKSIFHALTAVAAAGIVFASCTNIDSPVVDNSTSDAKYVMAKDSVVSSLGNTRVYTFEVDAEGRFTKEIANYELSNGNSYQRICNFSYGTNTITREDVYSNGETYTSLFMLNDKGLVEQCYDEEADETITFEYNDNDNLILSTCDDEYTITAEWKDGDLLTDTDGDIIGVYTLSNLEVDFPYFMTYAYYYDTTLAQMGYFGKPSRHLVSSIKYENEGENGHSVETVYYDYVVRNGLIHEITATLDVVLTIDGVEEKASKTEHHYITWKKF